MDDDETVLTPGGPRPRQSVHAVGPGQAVRRTPKGELLVENRPAGSSKLVADDEDLVLTPGGLRPKSLVFRVAPGHLLDVEGGRIRVMRPTKGPKAVRDNALEVVTTSENYRVDRGGAH